MHRSLQKQIQEQPETLPAVVSCRLYQRHHHGKNLLRTGFKFDLPNTTSRFPIFIQVTSNIEMEKKIHNIYFTHHSYMFRLPQCSHHQAVHIIIKRKLFIRTQRECHILKKVTKSVKHNTLLSVQITLPTRSRYMFQPITGPSSGTTNTVLYFVLVSHDDGPSMV